MSNITFFLKLSETKESFTNMYLHTHTTQTSFLQQWNQTLGISKRRDTLEILNSKNGRLII